MTRIEQIANRFGGLPISADRWPAVVVDAKAEGRAEGLREAWHILVQVSQNGGTLTEAIQSVHWRWCEAASEEG